MRDDCPIEGADANPRRRTRRDTLVGAGVTLALLLVLGLIGMVVLH